MTAELLIANEQPTESEEIEEMADGISADIAAKLHLALGNYVYEEGLGRVLGAEADFVMGKDTNGTGIKHRPDLSFYSFATLPQVSRTAIPVPPDLAVEVTSSRDKIDSTYRKVNEYRKVPIKLIWVVNPEGQFVEVFRDGEPEALLGVKDELDGGSVLVGFKLAVRKLFEE